MLLLLLLLIMILLLLRNLLLLLQVEQLTHQDLLQQLKAKGQRQPDYTRALIKEKLADADQEIATTSCKVCVLTTPAPPAPLGDLGLPPGQDEDDDSCQSLHLRPPPVLRRPALPVHEREEAQV